MIEIPEPILFNPWKHHKYFIKDNIQQVDSLKSFNGIILKNLKLIGDSQMDIYIGKYKPEEIAEYVIYKLEKFGVIHPDHYFKWLSEEDKEFKLIILSDESVWTLRKGNEEKRYVHIHPGRYSPHTIRVKANTLKTAITSAGYYRIINNNFEKLELINFVRKKYLDLSPVKSLASSKGILNLIDEFIDQE